MVRFGEAKAADELATRQRGQISASLRFTAVLEDRVHNEAGLDAHDRSEARVDPLDFPCNQTIGHVIGTGTAIGLGQGRAQQAQFTHFPHDGRIE